MLSFLKITYKLYLPTYVHRQPRYNSIWMMQNTPRPYLTFINSTDYKSSQCSAGNKWFVLVLLFSAKMTLYAGTMCSFTWLGSFKAFLLTILLWCNVMVKNDFVREHHCYSTYWKLSHLTSTKKLEWCKLKVGYSIAKFFFFYKALKIAT